MNTHNSLTDTDHFVVLGPEDIRRPRLAYTISEAAKGTGISLPLFKKLGAEGRIPLRYANSKPIVLAGELQQWVDSLPTKPQSTRIQDASETPSAIAAAHRARMNKRDQSIQAMVDAFGVTRIFAPPLAYTVAGAAAAVGIGQTLLREQIRLGLLEARYVNTKPIVMAEALVAWLTSLPTSSHMPGV